MHACCIQARAIIEHTSTATKPASTIMLQGELQTEANK